VEDGGSTQSGRPSRRILWVVRSVLVTLTLLTAGFLVPVPYLVLSPGPTEVVSDDFTIDGVQTYPIRGEYLSTSVWAEGTNAFGAIVALFHPDRALEPFDPAAYEDVESEGAADFRLSQELAAAAAARAVGLEARVSGSGVTVLWVDPYGPAGDELTPGDVIVAAGGRPVTTAPELVAALSSSKGRVALAVMRDGRRTGVEIEPDTYPGDPEQLPRIGAEVATRNVTVDLPFRIRFRRTGEDLGPSAGLAYALAIADALQPAELAGGRRIAATGEIDERGAARPVGGVGSKAVSVAKARAQLFVVPEIVRREAQREGLDVRGVRTLEAALELLRTLGGPA